jgi:predicted amidohydrolase YtcJ
MQRSIRMALVIASMWLLVFAPQICYAQTEVLHVDLNGTVVAASLPPADLVIIGAAIYTMDAVRSWAEALAVSHGKIVYVGTNHGAKAYIGAGTTLMQLNGEMVIPGLHDCHVHPLSGAIEREGIDLSNCNSAKEIQQLLKQYAERNPTLLWIAGAGWRSPLFPDANPNKSLLDQVVSDRPIYLASEDGHSAWVNSKALQLAKVTKDTQSPNNGTIERDNITGEPSGTLRESAAELVAQLLPVPDAAHRLELLKKIQQRFNACGITTVEDAFVDEPLLQTYMTADQQGILTMRVKAALGASPDVTPQQLVQKFIKTRDSVSRCKSVCAETVKIFEDGVIESHTAALTQPYLDRPDCTGILNYSPESLNKLVTALDAAGFQVHTHAIGDRAVHTALDAYENAAKANGTTGMRHQIAHLQLIQPADRPRFRTLGVIANFQPYWSVADEYMLKQTEPVLGPERSAWQYPMESMVQSGAIVVGGSDWPVTTFNPFAQMEVALRHQLPDTHGTGWHREQCVDLPTILAAYTIDGAYACKQEKQLGSLEVGKLADLAVLNQNLFAIPTEQIHNTKVWMTIFNGKLIYSDPGMPQATTALKQ